MPTLIRRGEEQEARISFTADFHELVRGKPVNGRCVVRYDPFRIVPASDYASPQAITMYVRFHPTADAVEKSVYHVLQKLRADLWDPAGQGLTVSQRMDVPEKSDELEFWFSYDPKDGHQIWDSAYGRNFWIRFPLNDLHIDHAEITSGLDEEKFDQFEAKVLTVPAVDSVSVRWRSSQPSNPTRQMFDLSPQGMIGSNKVWVTPSGGGIAVPKTAALVFDIMYTANGHLYTDDNEGTWYVIRGTCSADSGV
jgi:hypothetical protein